MLLCNLLVTFDKNANFKFDENANRCQCTPLELIDAQVCSHLADLETFGGLRKV